MPTPSDTSDRAEVARGPSGALASTVPIFDRLGSVYGYDVDFRSGLEAELDGGRAPDAEDEAGADLWEVLGLDEIVGLGRAHVAFSRELILRGVPRLLPPASLVVGVPGDADEDQGLIDACHALRDAGYELAVDDFHPDQIDSLLLAPGDIVRVDVEEVDEGGQRALCEGLPALGVRPLAKGVDTPERHARAREAGYWYFQGEFFRRPALEPGREVRTSQVHYLALLEEVNKPELAYDELEGLIRRDVAMTYGLLRFINSVWFGLKCRVGSIRHALVLLGPREMKLWASMLMLRQLGEGRPRELFRRCLIRAKLAESLAPAAGLGSQERELFLMGMLSLVEALTGVPLARVLSGLPVEEAIKQALLTQSGRHGAVCRVVRACEMGRWEAFSAAAAALGVGEGAVPAMVRSACAWADRALESL